MSLKGNNLLTEKLGRAEDALPHRRTAVELAERSWTCQGLANTLNSLQRYEEAEPWYAKAAAMDPDDYRHQYQWALCLMKLDRHSEAADILREAERLNPENTNVRGKLLTCLIETGEYAEVKLRCDDMLKIDPNHQLALQTLAKLYADGLGVVKDPAKAEALLVKSGRNKPPSSGRSAGMELFMHAQDYSLGAGGSPRDKVKALELYTQSYEAGGDAMDKAAFAIGNIYARGGSGVPRDPERAADWYKKAINAGSEHSQGALIELYLSPQNHVTRDVNRALKLAAQVRADESEDVVLNLRAAAMAYAQAERFDEAIDLQRRAVEVYTLDAHRNGRFLNALKGDLEKYERGEKPYRY
jgi:tetratricopeptide (TPR) repeat protein